MITHELNRIDFPLSFALNYETVKYQKSVSWYLENVCSMIDVSRVPRWLQMPPVSCVLLFTLVRS